MTFVELMAEHPWLTLFGWCWAVLCISRGWTPLVSVRHYTPRERKQLDAQGERTK